jgi:hypothetical protein
MGGLAKSVTLLVGLVVVVATAPPQTVSAPVHEPTELVEAQVNPPRAASPADDPRVRAFTEAYGPVIDSVAYEADDVVFFLGARPIRFQDGRMLADGETEDGRGCDSIFYRYSLESLEAPVLAGEDMPVYCTDVLESLWGRSEEEVRGHGRSVSFLTHRLFVNELIVDALASVERELRVAARGDAAVAAWIAALSITYSFIPRDIAGSPTRSHHAWGMAVDFVPRSYDGLHVYWRWSRVFDREGWYRIPLDERWSPPQAVIEIFERHGFVWGGKWAHFDVIHFEYRPEILLYNRMIADD